MPGHDFVIRRLFTFFLVIMISVPIIAEDKLHLRIGIIENPPKTFTDENGIISGFWADILVDVGITPNRQKKFLFSNETVLLSWRLEMEY